MMNPQEPGSLVPTLRVGTRVSTLCVACALSTRSVKTFVPTQSVGTRLATRVVCMFLALCGMLTGCASTGFLSNAHHAKKHSKATLAQPAVRCLCVWQTAEGFDPEGKPCRGVAGQVFFFTRDNDSPVIVDGDTKIFVFDNQGSREDQTKPIHQLDVPREQWKSLLTTTQFGPAYRLFVPYTRKGRHHAELALRVRMTPTNGPVVFSDIASIDLPGYDLSKVANADPSPLPVDRTEFGSLTETAVTDKVQQALISALSSREPDLPTRPAKSADQVHSIGNIITEPDGQRRVQSSHVE